MKKSGFRPKVRKVAGRKLAAMDAAYRRRERALRAAQRSAPAPVFLDGSREDLAIHWHRRGF
jgi:hypothetical protein